MVTGRGSGTGRRNHADHVGLGLLDSRFDGRFHPDNGEIGIKRTQFISGFSRCGIARNHDGFDVLFVH